MNESQESIFANILEKLERIEEEAARLTALTHAFVTPEHRQQFLSSTGQIWRDATAIGDLAKSGYWFRILILGERQFPASSLEQRFNS